MRHSAGSIALRLATLGVYVFMLAPLVLVVWLSFSKASVLFFPPHGYSVTWYQQLSYQPQLLDGLEYSLWLAAAASVISVVLASLAALGLSRGGIRRRGPFELLFLGPLLVPAIVTGIALYVYLYVAGSSLQASFVPSRWAMLLAHVVLTLPFTFRMAYVGLTGLDQNLERASLNLGRSRLTTTWLVTLPLMRSSLIGAAIFGFIFSFADLEISLFLVGPGQTTLPVAMLDYASTQIDPTIAAISAVQIAIIAVLLLVANHFVDFGKALGIGRSE